MPHKTLADTVAARETIYLNCGHPACCRSTKLDIQALINRLGADHGSMHWDLVRLFATLQDVTANLCSSRLFLITKPSRRSAIATGSRPSSEGRRLPLTKFLGSRAQAGN